MAEPADNTFLRGLGAESFASLGEELRLVDLDLGQTLMEESQEVGWVHFPVSSLLSLITQNVDGQGVETSMAGREGAAGLLEACGSGQSSVTAVVQVDGRAWRASAAHCRHLAYTRPDFGAACWKVVELQTAESRQSALCQALHPVQARFARWLLESLDRSGGRNPLPLTQEFLAAMLGVQRTTVSGLAAQFQRDGLITYSRGRLKVESVAGLEALTCECRRAMRGQRERLGLAAEPA